MSAESSMYQVPAEFITGAPAPEVSVSAQSTTTVELAREAVFSTIGERGPTPEQIAAIELHRRIIVELKQLRKDDFGLAA